MDNDNMKATNKKKGDGNGNSVIDNYERPKNKTSDYVSGDSTKSSSSHKFNQDNR